MLFSNQIQNAKIFVLASILYNKPYANINDVKEYFYEENEITELYNYLRDKKQNSKKYRYYQFI